MVPCFFFLENTLSAEYVLKNPREDSSLQIGKHLHHSLAIPKIVANFSCEITKCSRKYRRTFSRKN
jgi:hypothetical protein